MAYGGANKVFAAQNLAVIHGRGMGSGGEPLNPDGWAIAQGEHPSGVPGARVLTTLMYETGRRSDVKLGWRRCATA